MNNVINYLITASTDNGINFIILLTSWPKYHDIIEPLLYKCSSP